MIYDPRLLVSVLCDKKKERERERGGEREREGGGRERKREREKAIITLQVYIRMPL